MRFVCDPAAHRLLLARPQGNCPPFAAVFIAWVPLLHRPCASHACIYAPLLCRRTCPSMYDSCTQLHPLAVQAHFPVDRLQQWVTLFMLTGAESLAVTSLGFPVSTLAQRESRWHGSGLR